MAIAWSNHQELRFSRDVMMLKEDTWMIMVRMVTCLWWISITSLEMVV